MTEGSDDHDLRRDIAALQRGMERLMSPRNEGVDHPPLTGRDAVTIRTVVREEIDRAIEGMQPLMREIVRKEMDRERDKHREDLVRLMHDEAREIFATEVPKIFADLEMPIETPEDRRETRKKLGALFDMHENAKVWRRTFVTEIIKWLAGWIGAAIIGILAYMGVKQGGH